MMTEQRNDRDENEQLRVALEAALEENSGLAEDLRRLRMSLAQVAGERRQLADITQKVESPPSSKVSVEEELRAAYEELQVLAEELEVSNNTLQQANYDLDARVTERTRQLTSANSALQGTIDSRERSERRFRTLVEGMPQLVWRSTNGGRWTWASPQWTAYTGLSEADSMGLGWLQALHPDDRAAGEQAWATAAADNGFDLAARILHVGEGRYRHFRIRALPALADNGEPVEWLGTCTDVDDTLRLQQQQTVLVAELQHRTRNLMAVVHAITMRTLKRSRDLPHFRASIDDRLQALARAQSLLSRREGAARVAFDVLLRDELSAHGEIDGDGQADQVSTEGPSGIELRSSTVQTLALALHELATNAIRHGALSTPTGHLHVSWRLERGEQDDRLLLIDWRETGLAERLARAEPGRSGYGRELIERALPYQLGTRTSYELGGDGLHCTIAIRVAAEDIKEHHHA